MAIIAPTLLLTTGSGCRDDWQATTYPASGQLTINGKPAPGALIQLIATGQPPNIRNSRPWGMVDPNGHFTLTTYEGEAGAPPGTYQMTITWPVDASALGSPDRLGGKFANHGAVSQAIAIRAEPTLIPPIELTNIKVTANPRVSTAGKALNP